MKQFTSLVLIGVMILCSLNIVGNSYKTITQPTHTTNHADAYGILYALDYPVNYTIKNEGSSISFLKRLLPSSSQLSNNDVFPGKYFEIIQNNEISDYMHEYKYHVMHLQGSDIIHPFHYFW